MKSPASSARRRHGRRGLVGAVVSLAALAALAGWGMKHTSWFAPAVADALRSVFGADAVEDLERFVAGARDRTKRALPTGRDGSSGYAEFVASATPPAKTASSTPATETPFHPDDPGPMDPRVAAPGDGVWRALVTPFLFTTLLHPDAKRPWSRLWVFALDLRRLELHVVAGTVEPKSQERAIERTEMGIIAVDEQRRLVAAFNGGFKAEHGRHGMRVDGVTLLPPRDSMCTIAGYPDGVVRIAPWTKLLEAEEPRWFRQTPPCMVENGELHRGLLVEKNRNWGATLEGEVVIPRSAVGLGGDGTTLYFALSHDATPRILADGMRHVGAVDVAQLDVNWPYPRFVLFPENAQGVAEATSVVEGIPVHVDDYVRKPSKRDFFYVTARSAPN